MHKLILALTCCATSLTAQDILPCDWQASAQALVEPWDAHTRTFSNGATRLALLDTVEPAAGAFWILVLSPPYSELGDRQCRVIGWNGAGFGWIDFAALDAGYDPSVGLQFGLPVETLEPSGDFANRWLSFTLNQASGQIGAWVN